jgi:nucleoside-diphosphate-sugar epimerase
MMDKVCVFGASGFVGRALIERLISNKDFDVVAVIHSPGNAWPILRFDLPLVQADLSDTNSIEKAISECSYVVNLSLGPSEKMINHLQNLVGICKKLNVKRLIHLSSVTVYGDMPHEKSKYEDGPPLATRGTYGWYKNQQDKIINKANKTGLSSVVLCPPHITGAYGRIFHQVVDSIKNDTFALVEEGNFPCNIVDINNLCQAIELSLLVKESDGKRIFITNGDKYSWKDLAIDAARIAGKEFAKIPRISAKQAEMLNNENISMIVFLKSVLKNDDIKQLLRKTFLVRNKKVFSLAKIGYSFLKTNKKVNVTPNSQLEINFEKLNKSLCRQQLRGVQHKIDRARSLLNYKPTISSIESFKIFEDYYTVLYGYDTEYWTLSNQ